MIFINFMLTVCFAKRLMSDDVGDRGDTLSVPVPPGFVKDRSSVVCSD